MKLAVVGSRKLEIPNLGDFLPAGVTEIVSGGARGVDLSARRWAKAHGMPIREFLPDYDTFGSRAPLQRNDAIAAYCDEMLAFWDGSSTGTAYTVRACQRLGKPVTMIRIAEGAGAYRVTFLPGRKAPEGS